MLVILIIVVKKSLEHFWKMMSMYTFSLNCPIRTIDRILTTTTKWMKKEARSITSVNTASSGSYKSFPTINKRFWLTSIQEVNPGINRDKLGSIKKNFCQT